MRQFIGNRLFDSEKAEVLHREGPETLYRDRHELLFLREGEKVRRLTQTEAIAWMRRNAGDEATLRHFPRTWPLQEGPGTP